MPSPPTPSPGPLRPSYPIVTERLLLAPVTEQDVDALVAYRSLPDVCRYVPFEPMDAQGVARRIKEDWTATELTDAGQFLMLGVKLAATGELIGDVILMYNSAEHRSAELGWVFHPGHGGHGYATEAARVLLQLAFEGLGLHRVTARVDARNTASQRVCMRLGMRAEAHLIENEWFKGEWSSETDFALLEHEWRCGTV